MKKRCCSIYVVKDIDQLCSYCLNDLFLSFCIDKKQFSSYGSYKRCFSIVYSGLLKLMLEMNHVMRKPKTWFPNRSNTNRAVQPQEMARGWKFWI